MGKPPRKPHLVLESFFVGLINTTTVNMWTVPHGKGGALLIFRIDKPVEEKTETELKIFRFTVKQLIIVGLIWRTLISDLVK